jgi:trimethylamine--corrinoid protein Co-methyltransferase
MRGEAKPRRERRVGQAIVRQLPFARVFNRYRPIEVLSADEVEFIHRSALELLQKSGIEILHDGARTALRAGGAEVDEARMRVRLPAEFVEETIGRAPSSFEMRARNRAHDVGFGNGEIVFAATGGPAFALDLERGRRPGNFADMSDYIKLVHQLNVIHQEGGCPIEPTDLPAQTRHLDFYQAAITLTDKTWQCWALGGHQVIDALNMIGIAYGLTREEMRQTAVTLTIVNSNSPMRLDGPMADALMTLARTGQIVAVTPFTLAGAMSPVSLAGALTQQHAEALAMLTLAQIAQPGARVLYGGFTSNVDMRSGAPAFGTPEYAKAALASGQMARRLGIPYRSSNVTASNTVDVQAAYESSMSLWGSIMGGVSLIEHAAGWLEGGLSASFEKLILDAEMLQMMREFLRPIAVNAEEAALPAIEEVGPGGHFFGSQHTLARYQTAFYDPMLSDWRNYQAWEKAGAKTGTDRAQAIWKELLATYEAPPFEADRQEALKAYVASRKADIASGNLAPAAWE